MNFDIVYTHAMTKEAGIGSAIGNGFKWIGKALPKNKGLRYGSLAAILASLGLGAWGGYREGRDEVTQTGQPDPPDPFIEGMKKFPNMGKQNWINTAAGIGAGAATGIGLHEALKAVPGLKKRKLLRATLATLGGGGAGYLAWRAADNYQNASNNNQTA